MLITPTYYKTKLVKIKECSRYFLSKIGMMFVTIYVENLVQKKKCIVTGFPMLFLFLSFNYDKELSTIMIA